jgi:hypothetical protein
MINYGNAPGHIDIVADNYVAVADKKASPDKRAASYSYLAAAVFKDQVSMNNRFIPDRELVSCNAPQPSPRDSGAAAEPNGAGLPGLPAQQGIDRRYQNASQHFKILPSRISC